jgi:glyoxylase-like metal-dependent hydrolase (beta-lactamase superfamily II)
MFDFERNRIRFIRGGKYPQSNTVLIDDNIHTVIDPACNEQKLKSIHKKRPIEVLVNSHGHEDHFLYKSRFPEANLWIHPLDAGYLKDMRLLVDQMYFLDEITEDAEAYWTDYFNEVVKYHPRAADLLLEDNEILDFGNTQVQVLHTPGHTPGHLSFHFLNEEVIFLADLDLVDFGPYYGDRDSSIDDTIRSLERLAKIEADVYLVSHGKAGVLDADPAHIQRYINVIYQREEKLLAFLKTGPKSLDDVTDHGIIYGGHRLGNEAWDLGISEKAMMYKHLVRLEKQGSVKKDTDLYHLL